MEEKKIIQPFDIIAYFYPEDTPLRQLLIKHSSQVRDKALEILSNPRNAALPVNRELVIAGALLHDIGIGQCNAPDILCIGTKPYIAHGLAGAEMLRQYGKIRHIDMEIYARFCERHTSSGLTRENKGKTAYFAGINSAKFKKKVLPGDVLILETEIIKEKGPIGVGSGKAYVDGKLVCQAELTFAIG